MAPSAFDLSARRFRVACAVAMLFALIFVGAWLARRGYESASTGTRATLSTTKRAIAPKRDRNRYLGSKACTTCHADIADAYAAHPMQHSAGATPGGNDNEDFLSTTEFAVAGRIYRVVREDAAVVHHELIVDRDGEIICDRAETVRIFFGSGARGKSYAIGRDGVFYQSPISWYTRERKWALSPGSVRNAATFGRRIQEGCVYCHAGQPTRDESREDYFPEPVLLEAGIGCERCHGPGEKHVALRSMQASDGDDIVNPARLTPDRREAVCDQCHLTGEMRILRNGRSFGDFQPGGRLDDVWATLVSASSIKGGKTKAVSQVLQMRESVCFQQSRGRLGCISCHDPHTTPASWEKAAYYRQKCLGCHSETSCSVPADEQSAAPANNSCAYCHLPRLNAFDIAHVSQTDHRILRRPQGDDDGAEMDSQELVIFDEQQSTMPEWERERAKAIAQVRQLRGSGHVSAAMAAELSEVLRGVAETAADDAPTWSALATIAELRQDFSVAKEHWEHAATARPNDELALEALTGLCLRLGDYQAGLVFADRLVKVNPWRPRAHLRRGLILAQLKRPREAIAEGEAEITIDPSDKSAREWLITMYRTVGEVEAGNRHAEILARLQGWSE